MKLGAREYESELPAAERAVHDLEVVDADLRLAVRVPRVEVRKAVIVVEHRDDDPEEAADRRHLQMIASTAVVPDQPPPKACPEMCPRLSSSVPTQPHSGELA